MDHERLVMEMEREQKKWAFSTKVYGTSNVLVRFYLIVAAGVVAMKDSLPSSPLGALTPWVTILAGSIAVIAGIDAWLKPRDRWRGFMKDRDDLTTLIIQASGKGPRDDKTIEALNTSFAALRERHRRENVY